VEPQHFAGAGAEFFWPGSGYVNSCKMLEKTPNFCILKFEIKVKNNCFVATGINLREPFDDR
jgi:hypothetical protein